MGFLRLFLAICVVVTHTTPLFGLQLMPGTTAVQVFFIISGFYMSLVLSGRYHGAAQIRLFYSNRLLRLFPGFLVAVAFTGALEALAYSSGHDVRLITGEIAARLNGGSGALPSGALFAVLIPNLLLVGSDIAFLFHRTPELGSFLSFGMDPGVAGAVRMGDYILIDPMWSVGLELWFYLLIPFLVRWRIAALAGLAALSFALQWTMHRHLPWSSYFFFPANLGFFVAGAIGHKLWSATRAGERIPRGTLAAIAAAALALIVLREFIPFFRNYPAFVWVVAAAGIPFVFEVSKGWNWDRALGNLSYPVYLFHAGTIVQCGLFLRKEGWIVVLVTLAVAAAVSVLLEAPLERLRARRTARAAGRPPPGVNALAPS